MRINLFLNCSGCTKKHQNYRTSKARKAAGDKPEEKLNLKKYCKFCRKTQIHKEQVIKKKSRKK